MLAQKTFHDGTTEVWVWDGLALIRRGSDIYVNEPHVSGGVPILSKTDEGVRYHEHDFLGTTLWSTDTNGNLVKDYQDTTIFGEGSIQKDRSARFTGKPYDEDLQAYVFPYRNYDASTARWRSSDPAGYPDGINQHFYAAVATTEIDFLGLLTIFIGGAGENSSHHALRNGVMRQTCPNCGATISSDANPYSWTDKNEIISKIQDVKRNNPNEPINLVGHSYGGDTAYLVARDSGVQIDNILTLDPVSRFSNGAGNKPSNVSSWTNIRTTGDSYGFNDLIADLGGQWGDVNGATNISAENVDHNDPAGMLNYAKNNGYPNIWEQTHQCER